MMLYVDTAVAIAKQKRLVRVAAAAANLAESLTAYVWSAPHYVRSLFINSTKLAVVFFALSVQTTETLRFFFRCKS